MATVIPYSDENRYLAHEFLMKDPYKNTVMSALLEESGMNSQLIYDNGVIKGVLAVSPDYRNLWFYGNRASFKTILENIDYTQFNLYIDQKNLDIAISRFNFSTTNILVMRLKIRDYDIRSGNAQKLKEDEISDYGKSFGTVPELANTFVKFKDGVIVASGGVLCINRRSCALGSIKYIEGYENNISDVISAAVSEFRNQTENIVIYLNSNGKIRSILDDDGFIFTGNMIKLYKEI